MVIRYTAGSGRKWDCSSSLDQLSCCVRLKPCTVTDNAPVHLRGALKMLPWLCSMRCAMIRTMNPTVCCNRNLWFPLGCQVCWVPPDVLNVRAQALLCSGSWNCCLEMLLGLLGLFLLSSCIFLSLLSLFCRRLWIYHYSACQILLVFQCQNNNSVYHLVQLALCSKNLIQLYQVSASLVSLEIV